ncbi:MAG: hypothetical protein WC840_02305 [Candidatus Peribacteraceae bacterium]
MSIAEAPADFVPQTEQAAQATDLLQFRVTDSGGRQHEYSCARTADAIQAMCHQAIGDLSGRILASSLQRQLIVPASTLQKQFEEEEERAGDSIGSSPAEHDEDRPPENPHVQTG